MKLSKAHLCGQCEEIFDNPQQGACPACTNTGIFQLKKVIPTMKMAGRTFRVRLNIGELEKIQHLLKAAGPGQVEVLKNEA